MAARTRATICLFCQARQSSRSRPTHPAELLTRALQTLPVALRPDDDGFLLSNPSPSDQDGGPVLGIKESSRQWKLHSPIDELREAALGFDALWQRRDLRIEVLRNLSNPWPDAPSGRQERVQKAPPLLPEATAAVIPHHIFKQSLKEALGARGIRHILQAQLLRCEWPKEILRITAVAMMNREVAENLATLYGPLMRALYRCRQNVSDPEVLATLSAIISRFRDTNLPVEPHLLVMALKFAARARSLHAMKKFLRMVREAGLALSSNAFRAVIAKCSIGHRGLGEIRNGRWRRNELQQVLTGFEDAEDLPPDRQYHLGSFLNRNEWQYLHGWVAVLARCKDSEGVWREWELWKQSEARRNPKQLLLGANGMTTRIRGDYWFIEQISRAGDLKKAWKLLQETGLGFATLSPAVKDRLFEGIEHAKVWDESMQTEMVAMYDRFLGKIERALGVQWVAGGGEEGDGHHELYMDQEDALAKLGEPGWRLDQDYGYPYETDPIVPGPERSLHEAEEGSASPAGE